MDNPLFKISYGLYVLSVKDGEKDNACIINTAMQVTEKPNRITMAVNKLNYTCEMLSKTDDFTVSVISQDADFSLFKRFGFASGKDTDKFNGFYGKKRVTNGTYAITYGTNAYISCKIEQRIDLGSHILFICEVKESEILSDKPSVTYSYYLENIKPKPVIKEGEKKAYWRCKICGYLYYEEDLPEDFVCPLCKHGKVDFERV